MKLKSRKKLEVTISILHNLSLDDQAIEFLGRKEKNALLNIKDQYNEYIREEKIIGKTQPDK